MNVALLALLSTLVSIPQRSDLNRVCKKSTEVMKLVSIPQRSDLNDTATLKCPVPDDVSIPQRSDLNVFGGGSTRGSGFGFQSRNGLI